jgi:hypothetical protein
MSASFGLPPSLSARTKRFGINQVRPLWRELTRIRGNAFDLVVNCEGGLGENVLA